jgi:hypothetical protein
VTAAAFPGDLNPGDVIALPDEGSEVVVETIRLGQGGFVLTVSAVGDAASEAAYVITLTASTRVFRRGRWPGS